MVVDQLNSEAMARRKILPGTNAFSSAELDALPPYFGWVECDSGHSKFDMFLGGGDDGIVLRFFWNGSYEKTTLALWAELAKKHEFALDIGAHTGVYTLAAKTANPAISVAAFEPNPTNYSRLCLNMSANRLHLGNAKMRAVGARDETLPFSTPANSYRMTSAGALGHRDGMTIFQAQVVALDSFLLPALYSKVGLVKIDTEGHEAGVLEGMPAIIAAAKPIIFFECIAEDSGTAVQSQLEPLGYRFYEVDDDRGTILPTATVRPHFDAAGKPAHTRANRIAVPEGDNSVGTIA